jgi:hypothetical protein
VACPSKLKKYSSADQLVPQFPVMFRRRLLLVSALCIIGVQLSLAARIFFDTSHCNSITPMIVFPLCSLLSCFFLKVFKGFILLSCTAYADILIISTNSIRHERENRTISYTHELDEASFTMEDVSNIHNCHNLNCAVHSKVALKRLT